MAEKAIIYQVFTRLFGNRNSNRKHNGSITENGCGKMNDFDDATLKQIRDMGVTHIWYTGIIRHATTTDYSAYGIPQQHPSIVKGKAGSPYAITDYYDVDPDISQDVDNRMGEWEMLIERTHKAGMKVIMDFVPNHVARQYHSICKPYGVRDLGEGDRKNVSFDAENNFYYCPDERFEPSFDINGYEEMPARATGNDCFSAHPTENDWYETVKLNYGTDYCDAGGRSNHFSPIPKTWHQMTDILLFWASKGIDGLRCDMAEMVSSEFWRYASERVKKEYPDVIFIGEVYSPSLYREYISAGFDWLYDKVGMYDCVRDVICGRLPASSITHQWQSVDDINERMLYFLENHDEQRIASEFFACDGKKGIPGLIVCALMRQNPFMLYAGQEFGERGMDEEGFSGVDGRTTIFDYWTVDSLSRGYSVPNKLSDVEKYISDRYRRILNIASSEKAIADGLFFDLMYANRHLAEKQYAFIRKSEDKLLLIVANFSEEHIHTNINIPKHAFDVLNIAEYETTATDLITGTQHSVLLKADTDIEISVCGYDGIVLNLENK